jgi:hypothetical protein
MTRRNVCVKRSAAGFPGIPDFSPLPRFAENLLLRCRPSTDPL